MMGKLRNICTPEQNEKRTKHMMVTAAAGDIPLLARISFIMTRMFRFIDATTLFRNVDCILLVAATFSCDKLADAR